MTENEFVVFADVKLCSIFSRFLVHPNKATFQYIVAQHGFGLL